MPNSLVQTWVSTPLSKSGSGINLLIGLVRYRQVAEPGIMTIIVAIFFFGGIQLFFMGMIGEYILAIYGQVRDKPVVFERERINFAPTPSKASDPNR